MKKIILLEDDMMIASGLVYALSNEGYEVLHICSVKDALQAANNTLFDLGILDMQLPDGSGFEVCEKLKRKNIPVIFLTVVDEESEIVRAFDEGVEDYVVKPFRIRELLARVKRRLNEQDGINREIITLGETSINTTSGKVYIGEKSVELTALEYRLLLIFARNKSKLLTRSQILEQIWDIDGNYVEDNTLTVYVKRLREKLGNAVKIETVRGIGYRVDS